MPGETSCAQAGCHAGTVNSGPGNVAISFPSGMTYTPGVKQTWTVTVTDSERVRFGFQATARLASNILGGQAGTFTPTSAATQVICNDLFGNPRPSGGCPASTPLEFIEHSMAGSANTFTFDWTPPATDVGNVRVYVAGNGANGNSQSDSGDRIYAANYTLTPVAAGGGDRPTISAAGIGDAFNFGVGIAPNTWTAIYGANLAADVVTWDSAIQGSTLPTEVGGVTVTVNNKPAVINFVSPGQINILPPNDIGTGSLDVVVRNAGGESTPSVVTATTYKPAFYAPFGQNSRFYVTAVSLDGTYVGKVGLDPRVTRGAKPGEIIQVFGTGFGPTSPVIPVNTVVTGAPAITSTVRIRFGDTVANFFGSGNLVFAGLYQFNVTVPDVPDGEIQLFAEVGGEISSSSVYIPIAR